MLEPERLAEMIYEAQARLAPTFGLRLNCDREDWAALPPRNRAFMVATADAVLRELHRDPAMVEVMTGSRAGWQGGRRPTAGW